MKKAKASDMRHKVKVLEQVNEFDPKTGQAIFTWKEVFSLWCREITIFREQLETIVSGGQILSDRLEFECRYTTKLTSAHRVEYRGKMYQVSIVGDTSGLSDRIRFLAEALEDGGAR